MPTPLLSNFTPSLMSPETLERIFVQREGIAQNLVDRIILSATTPAKHHSLLIGARGMGKTHLVSLVYYRLQQHHELDDKLIVAWLREDEWGIDSWLDLVVRIFRALEETKIDTKGLLAQLQQVSISDAETLATQLLTELIGEKTLLLIVENLDDMFAGLEEKGQQKLRSFLQERQCCTILATTPALFTGVQDPDESFFELFKQIPLLPLSWEEATVMLQKIAELDGQADLANFLQTPAGKARIRAVHHLAGGNPRVYTLFAQFITRESLDELVQAFMKMLDDLTPYYQSRMKELSNQQRKIIEFLVDRREAVMVKEIATQCFVEQRVVSGQLLQLRNKGYVVARANGRESFYELTEVLMRLCMEVKKYRGQWVELFVDFLRIWYRPAERQEKLAILRGNEGLISDEHLEFALMSDADPVLLVVIRELKNCFSKKDRNLAIQLLAELQAIEGIGELRFQQLNKLINAGKFDEGIKILDRNTEYNSDNIQELCFEGLMLFSAKKWAESLAVFDRILAIDSNNADTLSLRGHVLTELGRYEEAINSYNIALEFNPEYSDVWNCRDILLEKLGKNEEAIANYDAALESNPNNHELWYKRGILLGNSGRYEESISDFNCAIELKPDDHKYLYNKGISLINLERYEESISIFDRAIKLKPDKYDAWFSRGNSLLKLGRYEESISSFDCSLKFHPDDYEAWFNRGIALINLGSYEKAVSSFDHAIQLKPNVYEIWFNRGNALGMLLRYEESIFSLDKALQFKPDKYPDKYEVWHNRGIALFKLDKYLESIDSYDRAISIKPNGYGSFHDKGFVLFSIGKYTEALTTWQQAFNIIQQTTDRPFDVARLIQEFIEILIPKFTQPAVKTILTELVQIYIQTSVLTELGTALVRTLKQILAPDISDYTAQQWLALWQELLGERPEMQLPFRLMTTAILYKQHPERKERLWLGLASEERSILDEALE